MSEAWAPTTLCERVGLGGLSIIERSVAEMRDLIESGEEIQYVDPLALVGPAARGDLDAQRRLAVWGLLLIHDHIRAETHIDLTGTLAETIGIARFAAAQGEVDDAFRLTMALALGGMFSWCPTERLEWSAECIARLEMLADDGSERAAELLAAFAGEETPEILEAARAIRARLIAVKEAD